LKRPRNPRRALWPRLSNKKKEIGNRKKGLLLKWNMIGGYSRKLRRMRVLHRPPPLGEVGRMDEDEGSRGEEDRGRFPIAELILKVVWLGIPLRYELMISRSILVGLMMAIHPLPLGVEGVDEVGGVEQEDVEDLLREEEDLMVMRRYSSLREVEPVKHLRIEHRRPRRPTYMYNKGKLSFLRTDLFSIISTDSYFPFSSFFFYLLFPHSLITIYTHSAHNRLHVICLRSLLLPYVALPPPSLYYLPGINQLSLPSKDLDLVNLLSLAVLLPLKHALKHKHHGENHNPLHNRRDRVRIDLIIDILLLLHNLPNYFPQLNDKFLDHLLRLVVVRVNMPWGLLINIDLIQFLCRGPQHRYIKVIDLLPSLLKLRKE
jgi:hypothetical protein